MVDEIVEDIAPGSPKSIAPEELERIEREAALTTFVKRKFEDAKIAKNRTERIHLLAFNAYRGRHDAETLANIQVAKERNQQSADLFIKVTKTKTQAAYAQLLEILLGDGNTFPISVEPTPVPEGVTETAHVDLQPSDLPSDEIPYGDLYGFKGDDKGVEPGATGKSLLAGLTNKYKKLVGKEEDIKPGVATDRTQSVEIHPAREAALNMQKVISDQLVESHAQIALRQTAFECAMLGTGVLKGPFTVNDVVHRYEQDPETKEIFYNPIVKKAPKVVSVSCWNCYPDPNAATIQDAEYLVERHLMTKSQVRDLINMPAFSKDALKRLLEVTPQHEIEHWENDLKDAETIDYTDRYEILEYWGTFDAEIARALGLDFNDEEILDQVAINAWVSGDIILRLVMNPFTPQRIPYQFVPYEEQPYQIWGVGIPENMRETQKLVNGHMRMAIDNLRLAGNMVFEIDERYIRPGDDMVMYPGKVIRKVGGPPGQSLHGISFPNTAESHLSMMRTAQQLSDQQTLPSIAHGQTGISGVGRTASGISMLMQAALLSIKTVIKNFDQYLLQPLGEAFYQWNMQFNNQNIIIRGDVRVSATGTESFIKKEVETQKLITFAQFAGSNQATAPLVNMPYVLKEIARNMGLNEEKILNDPETAKLMAKLIGDQQAAGGAEAQPQQTPQPGQEAPPGPGEEQFTGNAEQQLLQQINTQG